MGRDRVGDGRAIIEAADSAGHRDMMKAGWVYETNRAALDKCIAAMLQTKQDQRCVLTLPGGTAEAGRRGRRVDERRAS